MGFLTKELFAGVMFALAISAAVRTVTGKNLGA